MASLSPNEFQARRALQPVDPAPGLYERIRILDEIVTQLNERVELLETRALLDLPQRPRVQPPA